MDTNSSKTIFAFWEPKESIPSYLKLCMATWKKFLPEYEIILLDYSNIWNYIDKNTFDELLFKDFKYAQQADCLRCALLEKYGGIWFDLDTIITSENINKLINIDSEFIILGWHIGFIIAKKHAKILKKCFQGIKRNLLIYRLFKDVSFIKDKLQFKKWDYVGNRILNPILVKNPKIFYQIDRDKINALPEAKKYPSLQQKDAYITYYFADNHNSKEVLEESSGLIYLHNSWTPKKFKKMSAKEFINNENTMSSLLKTILTEEEINNIE